MTREGLDSTTATSPGTLYLRATRVMLLAARGDRDAHGRRARRRSRSRPRATSIPDVRAYVLQARAEAALLDGRPADALAAIEAALAEFAGSRRDLPRRAAPGRRDDGRGRPRGRRPGVPRRERVEAGAGRRAPRSLAQARAFAAGSRAAAPTPSVSAAVATVEAEATRLAGASDAAAWIGGRDAWDAVPMPYPAARARARAGEALLLVRGPRDEATRHLREAHAAAGGPGRGPLRTEIEAVAGRARGSTSSARPRVRATGRGRRRRER